MAFYFRLWLALAAACITLATAADLSGDASLRWGPYRPHLYLGIRPQIPKTLLMGLMWARYEAGHGALKSIPPFSGVSGGA